MEHTHARARVGLGAALALALDASLALSQVLPGPPVELAVPIAPTPFRRDGKVNLVYELHITNLSQPTLLLARAEILGDGENGAPIASYSGPEIVERLARPVPALKLQDARMIEGGKRGVLYLWLALDGPAPRQLRHRLVFTPLGGGPAQTIEGGRAVVRAEPAVVIGPPLRGTRWAARFLSNVASHRRSLAPLGGRAVIGQRFAIDFGKIGDDGTGFGGDGTHNSDAYSYDQDILAVADGVVARLKDEIPENDPNLPSGSLPNTWDTIFGNHLVLDIGGGHYAVYAHIRTSSFQVHAGDHIRRGQVLAHVGNSGNATGPHLHFQMCDSPDLIGAEGIPYMFDAFDVLGFETMEQFQAGKWTSDPGFQVSHREREMTPDMAIVRFL